MEEEKNEKITTIEGLAAMIQRTVVADLSDVKSDVAVIKGRLDTMDGRLDTMETRLDTMDGHLGYIDGRLDHMDARMGRMEADVAEIRGNLVYKHEFEDLMARVKYLEVWAGIESGK